ncbi:hypothetical protein MJO29_012467 [Puccinia striiformis f. sp. tritici]|nr:hypothetical protein MJO29_012467 [Puccinia striiformis f. sp. tritici]
MAIEEEINRKIAVAIDQISAKFDRKIQEQNNQIDAQRNEIDFLRKANTSHLDTQSQWTRVVNELKQIKIALNEVFGSAAPAGFLNKDVVSPTDNKLGDTKIHLPLKTAIRRIKNLRTLRLGFKSYRESGESPADDGDITRHHGLDSFCSLLGAAPGLKCLDFAGIKSSDLPEILESDLDHIKLENITHLTRNAHVLLMVKLSSPGSCHRSQSRLSIIRVDHQSKKNAQKRKDPYPDINRRRKSENQ